jgi:hypothetical protein
MPAPQITALPDPPSRQDPTNFAVKGDAFLGALPTFATEANALATQVNERVDAAFAAGLESAATNAATTVTKAAEARASELAAAGYANQAMLLSLGVETLRPSIKPSLLLDFARAQVVPPSVTFTRASTATRVGPSGLIETVGINVPRLDYDPITRACLGLLVEEQRANIALRSEEFDNASWAKIESTVTANATQAPDGLTTADKVIPSTAALRHAVRVSLGVTLQSYSFSVFAKAAEYSTICLSLTNNGANKGATIDLVNGVALARPANAPYTDTLVPKIERFPGGWFRITVTSSPGVVGSWVFNYDVLPNSADFNSSGDGTSGLFIWGAQIEAGSSSTSYIQTTTAGVTRAADLASVNALSPWYRADEGTLFVEALVIQEQQSVLLVALDDSATPLDNFQYINRGLNGTGGLGANIGALHRVSTLNQSVLNSGVSVSNAIVKAANAIKKDDFALSVNGSVPVLDTSGEIFIPNRLLLGRLGNNTAFLNGRICSIKYFPKRLLNSEIQASTTL